MSTADAFMAIFGYTRLKTKQIKVTLKKSHPASKAMKELCDKAEELGLVIDWHGDPISIWHEGEPFELVDTENENTYMYEFPPEFKYKLTANLTDIDIKE